MKERIQKLISSAGLTSRRKAEEWIAEGRVTVNGRMATLGESADPSTDRIEVDGKPLGSREKKVYLLLHKPAGYICTQRDPEGRPLVTELVKDVSNRLFTVGRLDLTTEGLLILTNDGEFAQHLAHPRHEVEKTYLVRVRGIIKEDAKRRLEEGVLLDDGMTAPAKVEGVRASRGHSWFSLTIHEGRNRQVRRMCEAVGYPVSRLKRIRIAFLDLGNLASGKYRHLTLNEVNRLKEL